MDILFFSGILLIIAGLAMSYLTYYYTLIRKKFTMTGGGFNLLTFASILLITGIILLTTI